MEVATSSNVFFSLIYIFFEAMLMSSIDGIRSCLEDYILLFLFYLCMYNLFKVCKIVKIANYIYKICNRSDSTPPDFTHFSFDSFFVRKANICCVHFSSTVFFITLNAIFLSGFFSRTFTIHRAAGEGGGYFFNPFWPLPPAF